MTVVLVGFMGAGKTTVGHLLAARLGLPFVDSDVAVEQQLGQTIREVFDTHGEPYFRDVERRTIGDLVAGPPAVVSLGGGAVEDPATRAVLSSARVVYLRVGYAQALARVGGDRGRPMLRRADLEALFRRRLPLYAEVATVVVDTDGRAPDAVAAEALDRLVDGAGAAG